MFCCVLGFSKPLFILHLIIPLETDNQWKRGCNFVCRLELHDLIEGYI
uniref:Uncharacterized protein n=1 Tax=Arundo donax TaxID=35708 RepID=A0A0A8ZB40_ARUDO